MPDFSAQPTRNHPSVLNSLPRHAKRRVCECDLVDCCAHGAKSVRVQGSQGYDVRGVDYGLASRNPARLKEVRRDDSNGVPGASLSLGGMRCELVGGDIWEGGADLARYNQ
jgi:hypothetical protein